MLFYYYYQSSIKIRSKAQSMIKLMITVQKSNVVCQPRVSVSCSGKYVQKVVKIGYVQEDIQLRVLVLSAPQEEVCSR